MRITAIAATALQGSIAKWGRITVDLATGHDAVDNGIEDCPLCQHYHPEKRRDGSPDCSTDCPIAQKTKRNYCNGSPYNDWETACADGTTGDMREAAHCMLIFLQTLALNAEIITGETANG